MGQQHRHGLLHHPGRFHDLRQEHLPGAEEVADDVHAGHQRALDDVERARGREPGLLGVGLDIVGDAVDERVREALGDRLLAPGKVLGLRLLALHAAEALGDREQPLGPSDRRFSTTSSQASRSPGSIVS